MIRPLLRKVALQVPRIRSLYEELRQSRHELNELRALLEALQVFDIAEGRQNTGTSPTAISDFYSDQSYQSYSSLRILALANDLVGFSQELSKPTVTRTQELLGMLVACNYKFTPGVHWLFKRAPVGQAAIDAAVKTSILAGDVRTTKFLVQHGASLNRFDECVAKRLTAENKTSMAGYLRFHQPGKRFYIDVFGYCNLRCPSCPVANWPREEKSFTPRLMTLDFLKQILEKALKETPVSSVGLFNWTEPLLHPKLPEIVDIINSYGLHSAISTNLNVLHDADRLVASNPGWLRVSVSGWNQDTYERGHAKGDIEIVKTNLKLLAAARDRHDASTDFEIFFHKYLDNEEDEYLLKRFSENLGFTFTTGWAVLMPVEKMLAVVEPSAVDITLSRSDSEVLGRLALDIEDALAIARTHQVKSCNLMDDYVVIGVEGDVFLCCATSGRPSNMLGKYLELSIAEIQHRKSLHPICGVCMKHGIPVLANFEDTRFDDIARKARATFSS